MTLSPFNTPAKGAAALAFMGALCVWFALRGLRKGVIYFRQPVHREEYPLLFGFGVLFTLGVAVVSFIAAAVMVFGQVAAPDTP